MPADSRTGIESRIVLRPVREVKETAAEQNFLSSPGLFPVLVAVVHAAYGVEGFGDGASARLVNST